MSKIKNNISKVFKFKKINPWLEITARIGYAAKGFLYLISGVLAFQIVIGIGGQTAGLKQVIEEIVKQAKPFGSILALLVAAGLIAHSFWRFMQSIFNVDRKKNNLHNILDRIGFLTSVVAYGSLAYFAVKLVLGDGSSTSPEHITAEIMFKPLGRIVISAVSLGIAGSGFYQIYYGISRNFQSKFNFSEMKNFEKKISKVISLIGLISRGIIFIILAIFLIEAAANYEPQKAGGMNKALEEILRQPFGLWLLGIISFGLAAYGGYCIILSRYRKFPLGNS